MKELYTSGLLILFPLLPLSEFNGMKTHSQPQVITFYKTLPLQPIESDHKVQIIEISELAQTRSLCSFIHELQANSRTNTIAALKEKAYTRFL